MISSENVTFRSIILDPHTELKLYYEDGVNFEKIVNLYDIPSCEVLPQGNFVNYSYMNLHMD